MTPTTQPDSFENCRDCGQSIAGQNRHSVAHEFYICERCHGYRLEIRESERKKKLEERWQQLQIQGLDLPEKTDIFRNSDPEIEKLNPAAWRAARQWERGENLYIHGPVGTGKSHMANCLLMESFTKGKSIARTSGRELATVATLFRDDERRFEKWCEVDLLLIDDLDKASWNYDRLTALWQLMDKRWKRREFLRTIVTTNIDSEKMRDFLRQQAGSNASVADSALDRLKPCQTIELRGRSQR